MFLSIIIPVYNVERYVEKCIRSCETQNIAQNDYELVCVNDGSTDGSLRVVQKLATEYSNISVIDQENQGLSMARNNALKIAKGDYIWFVDSDDWIEENCLLSIKSIILDNNLDAVITHGYRVIGEEIIPNYTKSCSAVMSGLEMLKTGVNCAAVKTIIKKSIFFENSLQFYPSIYHEDQEFTPRAYLFLSRIINSELRVYYNRLTPNSITQSVNPKKGFDLIIVAESLYHFMQSVDKQHRVIYHDFISSDLNQSMSNILKSSKDIQKKYLQDIKEHKYLLKSFLKSSKLYYKIEGVLISLGFSPLSIYSLIRSVKKNS